jgi:hypothetical protein
LETCVLPTELRTLCSTEMTQAIVGAHGKEKKLCITDALGQGLAPFL